jgi:hypothetical protein
MGYTHKRGEGEGERVLARLPDMYAILTLYFPHPQEASVKDSRHDIEIAQDMLYIYNVLK